MKLHFFVRIPLGLILVLLPLWLAAVIVTALVQGLIWLCSPRKRAGAKVVRMEAAIAHARSEEKLIAWAEGAAQYMHAHPEADHSLLRAQLRAQGFKALAKAGI